MAKKLNVSRTAIGKYENEKVYPDVEKLIVLSNIYNCSIDYLLGLSNNEKILDKNKIATLNTILDMAIQENIIKDTEILTEKDYKNLIEYIKTTQIAYSLFKRMT